MDGKSICNELKKIRRAIAAENDIDLEIPECGFEGPCRGTCPRCESEVRYLEQELARRSSLGKAVTVAGLSVSMAALGSSCDKGFRLQGDIAIPDSLAPTELTGELKNTSSVDSAETCAYEPVVGGITVLDSPKTMEPTGEPENANSVGSASTCASDVESLPAQEDIAGSED